jgi:hypothetical protein
LPDIANFPHGEWSPNKMKPRFDSAHVFRDFTESGERRFDVRHVAMQKPSDGITRACSAILIKVAEGKLDTMCRIQGEAR